MDFNIVVAAYDWKFTRSLVHQKFYSQPPGIFWNVQQSKNLWTCFDTADSVDDTPAQWVSFKCKWVINFGTMLFRNISCLKGWCMWSWFTYWSSRKGPFCNQALNSCILQLEAEAVPEVSEKYEISSVPTFLFFKVRIKMVQELLRLLWAMGLCVGSFTLSPDPGTFGARLSWLCPVFPSSPCLHWCRSLA